MYKTDHNLIALINNGQLSWTAKHYEMFEDMTVDDMIAMAGGRALHHSPLVTTYGFTGILVHLKSMAKLLAFVHY